MVYFAFYCNGSFAFGMCKPCNELRNTAQNQNTSNTIYITHFFRWIFLFCSYKLIASIMYPCIHVSCWLVHTSWKISIVFACLQLIWKKAYYLITLNYIVFRLASDVFFHFLFHWFYVRYVCYIWILYSNAWYFLILLFFCHSDCLCIFINFFIWMLYCTNTTHIDNKLRTSLKHLKVLEAHHNVYGNV